MKSRARLIGDEKYGKEVFKMEPKGDGQMLRNIRVHSGYRRHCVACRTWSADARAASVPMVQPCRAFDGLGNANSIHRHRIHFGLSVGSGLQLGAEMELTDAPRRVPRNNG